MIMNLNLSAFVFGVAVATTILAHSSAIQTSSGSESRLGILPGTELQPGQGSNGPGFDGLFQLEPSFKFNSTTALAGSESSSTDKGRLLKRVRITKNLKGMYGFCSVEAVTSICSKCFHKIKKVGAAKVFQSCLQDCIAEASSILNNHDDKTGITQTCKAFMCNAAIASIPICKSDCLALKNGFLSKSCVRSCISKAKAAGAVLPQKCESLSLKICPGSRRIDSVCGRFKTLKEKCAHCFPPGWQRSRSHDRDEAETCIKASSCSTGTYNYYGP